MQVGMGGVLFAEGKHPIMWHMTFPDDIQQHMVTIKNTAGNITNSSLEQAGVLAQANVANNLYDLHDRTLATLNDNIVAISQNHKQRCTHIQLSWCLPLPTHQSTPMPSLILPQGLLHQGQGQPDGGHPLLLT